MFVTKYADDKWW